jgi:hypothetical protein
MLRFRLIVGHTLLLSVGWVPLLIGAEPPAKPVFLYASLAGRPTFDEDAQGGNPFATALVELLSRKSVSFTAFAADLIALTKDASNGAQTAEVVGGDRLAGWQFLPKPRTESWVALVVVFSAYSGSSVGSSLPGAKRDLRRVADAFAQAGFVVTSLVDPDREALAQALKHFASRTSPADVAVIYTTGHGVEADGVPRVLLPYESADRSNALTVRELGNVARAKRANLIFYAACRSRPNKNRD